MRHYLKEPRQCPILLNEMQPDEVNRSFLYRRRASRSLLVPLQVFEHSLENARSFTRSIVGSAESIRTSNWTVGTVSDCILCCVGRLVRGTLQLHSMEFGYVPL